MARKNTVGTEMANPVNVSGAPSKNTQPRPRNNKQAGPVPGVKGNRKGVLERNGFKGAPQVSYVYPNSECSGDTYRNVRLVPSAKGNRDFYARRAEGPALVDPGFPGGSWTPPNKP